MLTRASSVALGLVVSACMGVVASMGVASASALPVDGGVLQFWKIPTTIMATDVETDQELTNTDDQTSEVDTSERDVQEPNSSGPSSRTEASEPSESELGTETEPTAAPADRVEDVEPAPAEPSSGVGHNDVPVPSSTDPLSPGERQDGGTVRESATGDPGVETPLP